MLDIVFQFLSQLVGQKLFILCCEAVTANLCVALLIDSLCVALLIESLVFNIKKVAINMKFLVNLESCFEV